VTRRRPTAAALAAAIGVVGACGGAGTGGRAALDVFAAASLTEALTALAPSFEAVHPGVEVRFTFGSSSALARQVADGAPADVLATADEATMAPLIADGRVHDPAIVARNRLTIAVVPGNPLGVAGLADLARPGLTVVLCAPEAPCGRLARAALGAAGITVRPASSEENVKAVLSRVTLGEADAGVVYVTDLRAVGGRAEAVAIDAAVAADPALQAVYPMAEVAGADQATAARAFVAFSRSAAGQRSFGAAGFLPP